MWQISTQNIVYNLRIAFCIPRTKEKKKFKELLRLPKEKFICMHLGESKVCLKTEGQINCGGPVVKNLPANARDMGSVPGSGRSCMPKGN